MSALVNFRLPKSTPAKVKLYESPSKAGGGPNLIKLYEFPSRAEDLQIVIKQSDNSKQQHLSLSGPLNPYLLMPL